MELFFPLLSQSPQRGLLAPLFSPFSATIQRAGRRPRLTALAPTWSLCTNTPGPSGSHPSFCVRTLSRERPRASCKLHTGAHPAPALVSRKPQEIASV